MKTLFKFLILLILLHASECTIEYYNNKLSEAPEEAAINTNLIKGCILPHKQFKRPKWVRLLKDNEKTIFKPIRKILDSDRHILRLKNVTTF